MTIDRTNYNLLTDDDGSGTTGTPWDKSQIKNVLLDPIDAMLAPLDISGASQGQIKFPAAQNPSSNVNTLDDYEEGTWTPALAFGGGNTGITYSSQVGNYVKVGKVVQFQGQIILTSKGSSTGAATITGLPFTSSTSMTFAGHVVISWSTMTSSLVTFFGMVNGNATTIALMSLTAASTSNAGGTTNADFSNTTNLYFSGSYIAAN